MSKGERVPVCECGHILFDHEYDDVLSNYTECLVCSECVMFFDEDAV